MNVLRAVIGIGGLALLGLVLWAAFALQDLHGDFLDQIAVVTTLPWGVIFRAGDPPRHPSQLYEFVLEGVALFLGLSWLFWRTEARRRPGLLMGAYSLGFGVFRVAVERAPAMSEPPEGSDMNCTHSSSPARNLGM